jgi:hypothetical protein
VKTPNFGGILNQLYLDMYINENNLKITNFLLTSSTIIINSFYYFLSFLIMYVCLRIINLSLCLKCMFGSTSGAARIDSGRVELILTCLVSQK